MIVFMLLLFCCIAAINIANKLIVCSLLAVLSITIANLIAEFHGKHKAFNAVAICAVSSAVLSWKNFHEAYSTPVLVASFLAVTVAAIVSIYLFKSLRITMPFVISNFISVVLASLIDTSITCTGLLNIWSANKVLSIYFKDFIFKISYAAAITVCVSLLLSIFAYIRPATVINYNGTR